ncbi:MAG: glycoside hydrolase family 5 protein [Eubacterium sp.]|nr:glycoside hydrolase family 5 protein [Eubacterium sp.]
MKKLEGYMHGVNLGGWLSQCDHTKERYDNFIKEEDIEVIKNWGLDHIRVPIDYDLVEDNEGNYKEDGFAYLDKVLDWAEKYNLNMILDLHKTFGFSFDDGEAETGFFENASYQERFYKLWEEFAKRYGKYSDRLCFEILNEVTDKEYCDIWNEISTKCIKRIRAIAPDIKILLGGYYNNSIEALKDLALPVDENIVYNFHCYEPLVFTHQGGYWVAGMDTNFRMPFDVTYGKYNEYTEQNLARYAADFSDFDQDKVMGVDYFENLVSEAVRVAEERNVALYCGEYGVINLATAEDTMKWYKMICSVFEKHGIGRAAWSYKEMDFGLVDDHMKSVIDELVKIL